MTPRGDLKEIRESLNARALEVCGRLLPHGRREGRLFVATNPRVAGDDAKLPALKVAVSGGDIGAWTDWRNGRDGHAGDLIGLVAYINGTDIKGALAWARDFLGLKAMSREERRAMAFAAQAQAKRRAARATKDRLEKFRRAQALFETGAPLHLDAGAPWPSPAERHARAYFAARHMALEAIPNLARATLRFSAATEWWRGAEWKNEGGRRIKVKPGPSFPAVHAAMRQWNGFVSACHCTFLDPVRPAKAPVAPAKLMYGEALGAVIEIAMGPAGEPFWACARPEPVILVEGIETGGPLAIAVPEARVWACGSISGFSHAPVRLDCVAEVYLAHDNNAGNAQARKQLDAAEEAILAAGKPLTRMASHVGDDFNDLADEGA